MKFTYNPAQISDGGLYQMRFELGDTMVDEPEKTAYLCDEEIIAAIKGSVTFKRAKFRLVESLLRRFSYEVDTKVKEASWSLHQRIDAWQKLYDQLKAEVEAEEIVVPNFKNGKYYVPPIFYKRMHDNLRGY